MAFTGAKDTFNGVPDDLSAQMHKLAKSRDPNRKGLHTMDPERLREVARMGGKAVHASGNARVWSREEAREAGKKGLEAQRRAKGKVQ